MKPDRAKMLAALNLLSSFRVGDEVTITIDHKDLDMTVTRAIHRADEPYGSPESSRVTVSLGVGRYSTEVTACQLAGMVPYHNPNIRKRVIENA